jgi:hypothetical protein
MANYNLILVGNSYHVDGLPSGYSWSGNNKTLLLVRYEAGDCDAVTKNDEKMHESLYDLYQCNDNLKDGDTFTLDGVVVYRCEGVHVVKVD